MSAPPPESFVWVAKGALEPENCSALIERFRASGAAQAGHTGGGVDEAIKRSRDLVIPASPEWAQPAAALQRALVTQLLGYVRRYPHMVVGGLAPRVTDSQGGEILLDGKAVRALDDGSLARLVDTVFRIGPVSIQHYRAKQGGFPRWHSEVFPSLQGHEALHRVLFFIVYLNDVEQGGTTDFFYQRLRVTPRAGTLVLAPAGFTHTHRGTVPESGDKYVATSWILFRPLVEMNQGGQPAVGEK